VEKQTDFDIVVIGGGIVGLASAYKIQMHCTGKKHNSFSRTNRRFEKNDEYFM